MKTILVIGCDEQEQKLITSMLEDDGFSVVVAKDWEDALSLCQNQWPIITIYNAVSAVEILYRIRRFRDEDLTGKLILLMLCPSEINWERIKPSCFSKYQADYYLIKPLIRVELIGSIKQLMRGWK